MEASFHGSHHNKFQLAQWWLPIPAMIAFKPQVFKEAHTSVAYPPWELKVLGEKVFSSGQGSQCTVLWHGGASPLTDGSAGTSHGSSTS